MSCNICYVGKARTGLKRYWCLTHKANATTKSGEAMTECVASSDLPISNMETLKLDTKKYQGGIALWGAVPAIFDTTQYPMDRGIHVHAREIQGGKKQIDKTFRKVIMEYDNKVFEINEEDAIYYMVAVVFQKELKVVLCNHCQYSHLDKDFLAVHEHKKHLCAGCGRDFFVESRNIGNPIMSIKDIMGDTQIQRPTTRPNRILDIQQNNYNGGIAIWGSNQAFVWTSNVIEEEGIHVHCYHDNKRVIDDTFSEVIIDGIQMNAQHVRFYMAQMALPHLQQRVQALECPACQKPHFDTGEFAYTPHTEHICEYCHTNFTSKNRIKKCVSNPIVKQIQILEKIANKTSKKPFLNLRSEGYGFKK